jgi:hypothetical protein
MTSLVSWFNLGSSVRVAGGEARLVLSRLDAGWGETLSGIVSLRCGNRSSIRAIRASLVEHAPLPKDLGGLANASAGAAVGIPWLILGATADVPDHLRTHDEVVLDRGRGFEPGTAHQWPFALTVPWGRPFYSQWYVRIEIEAAGSLTARMQRVIYLKPPPVYLRAGQVLTEVTGMPAQSWTVTTTLNDKVGRPAPFLDMSLIETVQEQERHPSLPFDRASLVGVVGEFAPRGWVRRALDGIRLEMLMHGQYIHGTITVNPQERSFRDVLRSLTRADRQRFPIAFPVDDLPEMRRQFREITRRFIG